MEELSVAFINLINNITAPFWSLLWAIGGTLSLVWIVSLGIKMKRGTAPGAPSVSAGEIFGVLIIASLIANYGSWLSAFSQSAGMGDITFGVLSYVDEGGNLGKFAGIINAALTFVSMMGGLFGMKGLYLLKQKASGEGKSGDLSMQAIVHIIGGGFLVQIAQLLSAFANSI
jgi:hypothetical protein